ncbi:MAG: hypothetical protein IJS73_01725 [Paludibacteraceae bacterium]|nr:hypothetical protein [Paludibacteraceae bacterium]
MNGRYFILYFAIILSIFLTSCKLENADMSWVQAKDAPEGRAAAAYCSAGNKAYILGGRTTGNTQLSNRSDDYARQFLIYNSNTDNWSVGSMPDAISPRVLPIATSVDNSIYYGLGYNGGSVDDTTSYLRDFWRYDPGTDKWERLADFPICQSAGAVAMPLDNHILVTHGSGNGRSEYIVDYDISADTWSMIEPKKEVLPFPPRVENAVGVSCEDEAGITRVYMGTGFRHNSRNIWAEWLPEETKWKKRHMLPTKGRSAASATCAGYHIYVGGGWHYGDEQTKGKLFQDVLRYHPTEDKWESCGTLPFGRTMNLVAFTLDGQPYFGLGEDLEGNMNLELWYLIQNGQ